MKERLTGAIILVALIVLLVPELLTGPASVVRAGKALGPAVAAGVTAAGSSVHSYTLPLEPPDRARAAAAAGPRTLPRADQTASRSRSRTRWAVQVGVFALRGDALRMQQRVRALGVPSRISRMSLRGRIVWRVIAGPVTGSTAGQGLARRLRVHGIKGELLRI